MQTKDRIMDKAAELFRRQGFVGTGLKQIAQAANAPFGSIYHFFPGGKDQLGEQTIRWSGQVYIQLFLSVVSDAPDAVSAVERFFADTGQALRDTDFAYSCPIATVAMEVAVTNEPMRLATADVFDSWIDTATGYFSAAGIRPPVARQLALSMLVLLDGAFVFSRALRSTEPVEVAGAVAAGQVRQALSESAHEAR